MRGRVVRWLILGVVFCLPGIVLLRIAGLGIWPEAGRDAGLSVAAVDVWGSVPVDRHMHHAQARPGTVPPVRLPDKPQEPEVDTAPPADLPKEQLQQTSWFAQVQENIRKSEYNITWQDTCVVDGEPGGLHAANRANNLRAYFREDGLHLMPRENSEPEWELRYRFTRWGRGKSGLVAVPTATPTKENNRVEYLHSGITEWYVNAADGLEHGFTIQTRPEGESELVLQGQLEGTLNGRLRAGENAIEFERTGHGSVMRYAKLMVKDAEGKILPGKMALNDNELTIRVADAGAVYPVTVDPIWTPPPPQATGTNLQFTNRLIGDGSNFGYNINGVGDINGDGYADVVARRSSLYGYGHIFLGSSDGLQGESLWDASIIIESTLAESTRIAAWSSAGDVNGDGYADVLASTYEWLVDGEMTVLLYLGSPDALDDLATAEPASVIHTGDVYMRGELFSKACTAGDVNADGYSDVLIGIGGYNEGEPDPLKGHGAAMLFLGSAAGLVGSDPETAAWYIEGQQEKGYLGSDVSGAGDVNGDGYDDVLIGSAFWRGAYQNGEEDEGAVFVFMGSASGLTGTEPADADAIIEGNVAHVHLGREVSRAGDVNGDGYDDVLLDNYLFLGSSEGLIGVDPATSAWAIPVYGHVTGVGDVNCDGYADVLVGEPSYSNGDASEGAVFLFLGSEAGFDDSDLSSADTIVESNVFEARLGSGIAGVGDINGDGFADVVAGAPDFGDGREIFGALYSFHGAGSALAGLSLSGAVSALQNDSTSFSSSAAGDVDGDGYADVMVGAYGYDNGEEGEGMVFVFLGSSSGLIGTDPSSAAFAIESNIENMRLGAVLSSAGDVNADGYSDIIIGNFSQATEDIALVFLGSSTGLQGAGDLSNPGNPLTAATLLEGEQLGNDFGRSVAGVGDVNADGYGDVLVGASLHDNGEINEGAAFLFLGSETGLQGARPSEAGAVLEGREAGSQLGRQVAAAGDVNGDGYADVLIRHHSSSPVYLYFGDANGFQGTDPATAQWTFLGAYCSDMSGAGDVNGDRYGDIILGSRYYSNGESGEGAAFLFLGSPTGPVGSTPSEASALLESNLEGSDFGASVSSARDLNGDGFADVIVGAPDFTNGEHSEGALFVFLGSEQGLVGSDPSSAAVAIESNIIGADLGQNVSGVGDVNGDGYADVLVSASSAPGEDAVFLFLGNSGYGAKARVSRLNGPLSSPGTQVGGDTVRLEVLAERTPAYASAVRLEWEVKPCGWPFDGEDTSSTVTWLDPGANGYPYDESITVAGDANGWKWRARLLYAPMNQLEPAANTPELTVKPGVSLPPNPPHSRWFRPQWATVGPSDFRTSGYRPPTDPGNVQLAEGPLLTTDDIVCTVGLPSESPAVPAKHVEYEYEWVTDNGSKTVVRIHSDTVDGIPTDSLPSSETAKHEVWSCTVRAWDGVQYSFRSDYGAAPEILNTPPGAPAIFAPLVESTSANLTAQVVGVSEDPDIDPIQYDYDWYLMREGESEFSLFRDGVLSPEISSQINFSDTAPGDEWYVVVTPWDGEEWGDAASTEATPTLVVQGGVIPSTIFLAVSPSTATLGESITASGSIFPVPAESYNVTFSSTSPSGSVLPSFPDGVISSGGPYTKAFIPTEASEGRSDWSLTASWDGDDTYTSATSAPVTFEVLRAQPVLSLDVSPSSALMGLANAEELTVTATISVPGFPAELEHLLEGLPIGLSVVRPDSTSAGTLEGVTDAAGVATFTAQDLLDASMGFENPGLWKFKAEFIGDHNFHEAATADFDETDAILNIKRGAGYAIIVLGRLDAYAEGHREHAQTTDYIYRTLREREFDAEDIYYLREYLGEETTGDDVTIADVPPTKANLLAAIEGWALGKMTDSPAPLYLMMVDHGSSGQFHLYDAAAQQAEHLSPSELAASLSILETGLAQTSDEAASQPILIFDGSCYSGSFIPTVSGGNRVVITSTDADSISFRGVQTEEGVRDGEFFLTEFFRNAGSGKTLRESFDAASRATVEYTASSSGGVGDSDFVQIALLDDNGDSSGSAGPLTAGAGEDGHRVKDMTLGLGSNAGNTISWFTVTPSVALEAGAGLADSLSGEVTGRTLAAGDSAWLEVKTPQYAGGEVADEDYAEFQQVAAMVGPIAPTGITAGDDHVEWSADDLNTALGFTNPGTYKAYYFLRDGTTGQVSSYLVTNIYVPRQENVPPEPVDLLYPTDGLQVYTQGSTVWFAWLPADVPDADDDAVTFTLEVSADEAFPEEDTLALEGIAGTSWTLDEADGLTEGDFFWRVIAVDEFGAASTGNAVRGLTITNGNPTLSGPQPH